MTIQTRWNNCLRRSQDRFGKKRVFALGLLAIVGLASLAIHLLGRASQAHTAMLYVAIPYAIAVMITLLRPYDQQKNWSSQYASHSVTALVVFLASSVLLMEGFICVIFFMPIYFLGVTVAYVAHWIAATRKSRRGKTYSTLIPVLIALLSMEGTSEVTTFDRHSTATATVSTALSPEQLLENLAKGFALRSSDDWMLGLFPMPHTIEAGSLEVGDIHRAHTRYRRWFFTNEHEGEMELRIDSVTPGRVVVSFVSDTSYFSSYIRLIRSDIRLATDADGTTLVSLAVSYERRLDPAWYFQPIQRYAVQTMAAHLIEEILIRE